MGSEQQFCLRWNNHQSNLLNVFDDLLKQETLVDVTLACEGITMKAHKVVLSACSPYFRHIFQDNPCQHPVIILKDVRYDDLKTLVDFMYKGEVNVSQDQLSTLLNVAESLKVKGLAEVTESMTSRVTAGSEPNEQPVATQEVSVSGAAPQFPVKRVNAKEVGSPPRRRKRSRRASDGSGNKSDEGADSRDGNEENSRVSSPEVTPVVPKTEVIDIFYEDVPKSSCDVLRNNGVAQPSGSSSAMTIYPCVSSDTLEHDSESMAEMAQAYESADGESFLPCSQQLVEGDDSSGAPRTIVHHHPQPSPSTSHADQSIYFPSTSSGLPDMSIGGATSIQRTTNNQEMAYKLYLNSEPEVEFYQYQNPSELGEGMIPASATSSVNSGVNARVAQRIMIRSLVGQGESLNSIYTQMRRIYGASCMTSVSIKHWYIKFQQGVTSVKDKPRSGRPPIANK